MSYVQEDSAVAEEIAQALAARLYTTWYYERDSVVGTPWLTQVGEEINGAKAVVLIISRHSLESNQVTTEIDWARTKRKPLVPVLLGITHEEIEERQLHWAMALGTIVTIPFPAGGMTEPFLSRLAAGLERIGITPSGEVRTAPDALEGRFAEARRLLNDPEARVAAEAVLRELAAENPQSARVHRMLAELYNRSFRPRDALASSERAVRIEPNNPVLLWELGLAYERGGRLREAASSLSDALDAGLDPTRERHARTLLARLQRAPA